jgi:uncharacterized protein YbjT (DUF2867 family)
MSRSIIVTGATGKQGGAVIHALLADMQSDFMILAVTRDPDSASAQRLAAKSTQIKLVRGDLDDAPELFKAAQVFSPDIWGVFSVQVMGAMNADLAKCAEVRQGVALIDASVAAGVRCFVYSSVDRGGEPKSWDSPTAVPHFRTKHYIEHYLRDHAGGMGWTILRPVTFFDNLAPNFPARVFMSLLSDKMGPDRTMPWIACSDIGFFAALAFCEPKVYNHRALCLAGDNLNMRQMNESFEKVLGYPVPTTYSFLGSALYWAVSDIGKMVDWFVTDGCDGDLSRIDELRKLNPKLRNLETWLREESKYTKKQ